MIPNHALPLPKWPIFFSPDHTSQASPSVLMLGGRDTSFRAPLIDLRKSCQQRQLEWRLMTLVNDCRVMGLRKRRLNIHKEGQKQGRGSPQHLPAPQRGLVSLPPAGNSVLCCPATNAHFLPQMHTLHHIKKLAGVDQDSRGAPWHSWPPNSS